MASVARPWCGPWPSCTSAGCGATDGVQSSLADLPLPPLRLVQPTRPPDGDSDEEFAQRRAAGHAVEASFAQETRCDGFNGDSDHSTLIWSLRSLREQVREELSDFRLQLVADVEAGLQRTTSRHEEILAQHWQALQEKISKAPDAAPPQNLQTSLDSLYNPLASTRTSWTICNAGTVENGQQDKSIARQEIAGFGENGESLRQEATDGLQGLQAASSVELPRRSEEHHLGMEVLRKEIMTTFSILNPRYTDHPETFAICFRRRVLLLLRHRHFTLIVVTLIVLNAGLIGVQVDWAIQNVGQELPLEFRVLDICFAAMFTLELCMRLYGEQWEFFSRVNENRPWNIFDSGIVIISLVQTFVLVNMGSGDVGFLRLLKIARLMRLFRTIRLAKEFRNLRVMVMGIMSSVIPMMWAILLLLAIMFMFAALLVQHLEEMIKEKGWSDAEFGGAGVSMRDRFGSLAQAMFTLGLAILGGVDWGDVAWPLLDYDRILGIIFVFYVTFSVLCVLNIITGIFVESANRIAKMDKDHVIMEDIESREKWAREVTNLFRELDEDGSGYVEKDEFTKGLVDHRVQALLRNLGIDVATVSAEGLWKLLQPEGDCLELEEFCTSIQMLHGEAQRIDMVRHKTDIRKVRALIECMMEHNQSNGHMPAAFKGGKSSMFGSTISSSNGIPAALAKAIFTKISANSRSYVIMQRVANATWNIQRYEAPDIIHIPSSCSIN